jgi:predicted component of type VI protein secretion system
MPNIDEHLKRRSEELMVHKMPRNKFLMDEIFEFDPKNLEATSSANISKYTIGLAQFLIYFTSQINNTKVWIVRKNRIIDTFVNKSDIKAKTKAEKYLKVIDSNPELQKIQAELETLEGEVKMTENLEKYYIELINAFKRELTRRETDERRL